MVESNVKTGNIFVFIWNKVFKGIFNEWTALISAVIEGFKFVFITGIPVFIKDLFLEWFKDSKEMSKLKKENGDTFDKRVKEWLEKKYNNLSFVKEAKRKKEANLIPIVVDADEEDATAKFKQKQNFRYMAKNKEGKIVKDYFSAYSKMDVYSYLMDEGMTVYSIEVTKSSSFLHSDLGAGKRRMSNKDLTFWLTQLSTYVKAGIPLTEAVKVLAQQDNRSKYKTLYESIIFELTTGNTFSEALRKQGNSFPPLLVNMVKSSEMVGNIEDTLDEMSAYYQEIEETKRAIISALAYPMIVLVFAIGIVTFMLVYIVPQFKSVYESMGAKINPITQACLDISEFLKTKWMYIILIVVSVIAAYTYSYKKIKSFRYAMQSFFMKLPVVGKLMIAKEMALFSRTFATLQKNNVLLTDSIDILAKITSNEIYKEIMMHTIEHLLVGDKMSESFKDHWAIPDVAYFMIVTGESTGELAEMLDRVADFYQKQERQSVASIKTFIEPIMILFLAIMVGFILVAILVPMFGIYQTVAT